MKTRILSLFALIALVAFAPLSVFGQATVNQTTLNGAVTATQNTITLTSATTVVVGQLAFVDKELMLITALSGTVANVNRGWGSTSAAGHATLSTLFTGPPNQFGSYEQSGSCTLANTIATPYINTSTGNIYVCVNSMWTVPWPQVPIGAAVASAAGAIVPSGALFHVTGTAAITGFTLPAGFISGSFCVIPDGIFTTTAAGNIALASTAVVSRQLCFAYDTATAKFYPSY